MRNIGYITTPIRYLHPVISLKAIIVHKLMEICINVHFLKLKLYVKPDHRTTSKNGLNSINFEEVRVSYWHIMQ